MKKSRTVPIRVKRSTLQLIRALAKQNHRTIQEQHDMIVREYLDYNPPARNPGAPLK